MYNETIFAHMILRLIVGGILDQQGLCVIQCSYFLNLSVIIIIFIHVAETQKSEMVLICPYYKKNYMKNGWVG